MRPDKPACQVSVIGAGPAGLAAAERLASLGCKVTLHDRKRTPGRKLLLAGRGGLNLTNSEDLPQFLTRYGAARSWLEPAIAAFPPDALRRWAEGLGQELFVGSSGRVFPRAMKSSGLLRAWLGRLASLEVVIRTGSEWIGWNALGSLRLADGSDIDADAVLLALGGASWPQLGSDASWLPLLAARGVAVAPLRPANCGMLVAWSEPFRTRFAGLPLKNLALHHSGVAARGDLMLTARGIEGGPLYALAASLRDEIERDGYALLQIDLRPDLDQHTIAARLARVRGRESLSNRLRKGAALSPEAIGLLREAAGTLPSSPEQLAALIKTTSLRLDATDSLQRAISTAGGIRAEALDANFMLRALPGVFAAGEMLDWEAPTGGYLLQASIATGLAAADGLARWLRQGLCP